MNRLLHKSFRIHDYFLGSNPNDYENFSKAAVLASLVHTEGSCYQKAGAQLLLSPSDQIYGLISGGCLEHEIIEQAQEVRQSLRAKLVFVDTGDPLDVEFGYGLGCGGKLWILIEPVSSDSVLQSKVQGPSLRSFTEAIVIKSPHQSHLGERAYFQQGETQFASCLTSLSARLRAVIEEDLSLAHQHQRSNLVEYAEAQMTVAYHNRSARPKLSLFGCGAGSWPLAKMVNCLGWDLDAFDHRPSYLEAFAEQIGPCRALEWEPSSQWQAETMRPHAAIVMTHNYQADFRILQQLLQQDWSYIGLLGSRARSQKLIQDLISFDPSLAESPRLASLRSPVGLDLGGSSPESIALAIVSQAQAIWHGKIS